MNARFVVWLFVLWWPLLGLSQELSMAGAADVRRFGAIGDGVADDAPAIQAALDSADRVYLPPGIYRVGSRLAMKRSGMALIGSGASTTVLKPDASLTTGTLIVAGASTLTDIEIGGFKLDGSADPTKVQGIGVYNCKRVRIRGISPVNISGMIGFEGVEDFSVIDIAGKDLVEFISMIGCQKGVLSNIRVDGADEGFDFFNCDDVEITGAVISARDPTIIRPAEWAVGVDLSSSRRITISQCTFVGQYYGIKIKHDVVTGLGSPRVEDVLISACQIHEYRTAGILLAVDHGRGCRIQGCTIRSTKKDATGIYGFLPSTSKLENLVVADCSIDSTHTGIRFNNYDGAEIRNCRIAAGTSHAINIYECSGLIISGCRLRSAENSAVLLTGIRQPLVESCDMAGVAGIWVVDCRSPAILRNSIPSAKGRGISVQWTSDYILDDARSMAGFIIDQNVIRNWGEASAGNGAIAITITGIPAGSVNLGSVTGNHLLLSSAEKKVQYGVTFSSGRVAALDWVKVSDNVIYGAYAAILGAESLGANCVQSGNLFKQASP